MVDGEAELLIGQTRICRVKNCADARNGIEKLEVAVRVPGEGTEGVARLRAHGNQAMSKAGRATAQSRIVIAEQGLVDQPGHDLPAAMGANGIIQDVRNLQGAVLYEAGQHVSLPEFVATLRFADMRLPSRSDEHTSELQYLMRNSSAV